MAKFGYETQGAAGVTIQNNIRGSWHTCPETGTADSMTVYIIVLDANAKLRAAIYKKSDDSYVGETEEKILGTGSRWETLNFADPKPSLENIDYYLVGWAGDGRISLYQVAESGKGAYDGETYNSFPNPWDPTSEDRKFSVYCTYTPSSNTKQSGSSRGFFISSYPIRRMQDLRYPEAPLEEEEELAEGRLKSSKQLFTELRKKRRHWLNNRKVVKHG